MSTLYVDTITEKTSGNGVQIPGHVVQVQSAILTSKASTTSQYSTYVDTGLSISITPKFSTSKILVTSSLMISNDSTFTFFRLLRDTTALGLGDAAGSRHQCTFMYYVASGDNTNVNNAHTFLDSPATTSLITYKWTWCNSTSSFQSVLNAHVRDADAAYEPRGSSTITVMEIAQ
jgi:hypothetical protein